MTTEAIVRWFRRFRFDREFRSETGSRTVPMSCLCRYAGVPRPNVYAILRGERTATPNQILRLTQAIAAVEAGLRWHRIGKHNWHMVNPERFMALPRYERPKHRIREDGYPA